MDEIIKTMVEEYQCPGCVCGSGTSCYKSFCDDNKSVSCKEHCAGTASSGVGRIFLGMPKGFDRIGHAEKTRIYIFKDFNDGGGYDMYNVPVWKHLDNFGNTIVRGISPRINNPWIRIFYGDVRLKIHHCIEITKEHLSEMD